MGDAVLARRYAEALFELASEEKKTDKVGREIAALEAVLRENPDWLNILNDRETPEKIKRKMVDEASKVAGLERDLGNLLKILAEKKRCFLWPLIVSAYKSMTLELKEEVEALVTVADKDVWKELKGDVAKTVQVISGKKPILKHVVDPSIIGGLTIEIGDTLFDGSIKGELRRRKEALFEGTDEIFRR